MVIADFVYMQDGFSRPYGWGIAKYSTSEELLGYKFVTAAYKQKPDESKKRICGHLVRCLPGAEEKQLLKLLQ